MDEFKNKNILFKYTGSKINQFELNDKNYTQDGDIGISLTVSFGVNKIDDKYIVCVLDLTFTSNNNKYLFTSILAFFEIEEESWKKMINKEEKNIKIPQNLCTTCLSTTMNISRGVLLVKLESTVAEKTHIPPISVSDINAGDIIVNFDQ